MLVIYFGVISLDSEFQLRQTVAALCHTAVGLEKMKQRNKQRKKQVAGLALGACSWVRKTLYTEINWKKIKDGHNGTKIGSSNIIGGNQLRFRISAQ